MSPPRNRRTRTLVAVVLATGSGLLACSSSDSKPGGVASSGNAFCDDYGTKLLALGCSQVDRNLATTFASICKSVLDAETSCAAQYKDTLTCQATSSTCAADGNLEFAVCPTQQQAYGACKTAQPADGGTSDGGTSDGATSDAR